MSSNFAGMNPNVGMDVGMGYRDLLPTQPGYNPVADQTQQMANNPVYGQNSPFQPPMPQPQQNPNVSVGFGPAPIDTNMSFGKNMGSMIPPAQQPVINPQQNPLQGTPMQGPGQMVGGPVGKPIMNQPNPAYQGGLRPAPRNYRPPFRTGGILRSRMR